MQGYEIIEQGENHTNLFVKNSIETVCIQMDFPLQASGLLKYKKKKILSDDFVFGLLHTEINELLELPLICCLVNRDDWIKSE